MNHSNPDWLPTHTMIRVGRLKYVNVHLVALRSRLGVATTLLLREAIGECSGVLAKSNVAMEEQQPHNSK